MTGIPKRMPDHTEDLSLVNVAEDILDSTIKSQITSKETLMVRDEFNISPVSGIKHESDVPLEHLSSESEHCTNTCFILLDNYINTTLLKTIGLKDSFLNQWI